MDFCGRYSYKMEPAKKMRKREKPQKKWTEEEHDLLLDYLLENVDIERPTAQIYYRNLIKKTNINATSDMLRCKVRYFKHTYYKAEQWLKSTGADLDIGDESTIKEKLKKMCPYYDRLSQLFRNKAKANVVAESSTFDVAAGGADVKLYDLLQKSVEVVMECPTPSKSTNAAEVATEKSASLPGSSRSFGHTLKTRTPRNSLNELAFQMSKYFQSRLEIEQDKLKLEKIKLEMEKERLSKEFELKKMELEQKERLALIELKYKYNRSNL